MTSANALCRFLTDELTTVYDLAEARALAYRLLEDLLHLSRTDVLLDKALPTDQPDWQLLLNRLKRHEPIQYVLGQTEFYGRRFHVTPATLIPRPETEELVSLVIQEIQNAPFSVLPSPLRLLDIGTGSGCIAITLALELPQAEVWAWDISREALDVARQNAQHLRAIVHFEELDTLQVPIERGDSQYTAIVSNPPYVTRTEAAGMHSNVLDYEPHLALFVPDTDPLLFYRAIAQLGKQRLLSGGVVFVEINQTLGTETASVFSVQGYSSVQILTDLSGNPRFVRALR